MKKEPTKNSNPASNQKFQSLKTLFSIGEINLIFRINFTDKDLEKAKSKFYNGKKTNESYYKIENIKTLKDLSFISNKKEIINNIILKPNNPLTKQLLYGNKISKKKCCIDLIGFGRPKFERDEEFFNEIFNQ